jgi:hypothetical protein
MTNRNLGAYLKSLGMAPALVKRGQEVGAFYSELVGQPIRYAFVNEYRDEDNTRQYESAWFLFERYACEAFDWISGNRGDIASVTGGVLRAEFNRKDYDFDGATDASRLTLEIHFAADSDLTATFKASGTNCDVLAEIWRSYFFPQMS